MKNYTLYRYDFGWDAFERAMFAQEYTENFDGKIPTDEELTLYIQNINNDNWNDLMTEIRFHEQIHGKADYIIKAQIGTWHGTLPGGRICTGLRETIRSCCEGCDFVTIAYKHNQLCIVGHHHDGTNHFYIREITDAGMSYVSRHLDDPDPVLHYHVFTSSKWSKMVSLFPKMYGWV